MLTNFSYGTFPRPLNTQMDPEEWAYQGGLTQGSRYGRAVCSDGKVRRVKLGLADTFFTIPARVTIRDKTVSGYVSSLPCALLLGDDAPDNANEILAFYPTGKHRSILPAWDTVQSNFPPEAK